MAALTWDNTGEKLFETGVDRGVLYPWDSTNSTYGTGVAWNGLTSFANSPEGADPTDLWADNIKYAVLRSAETFKGTIEAYMYPDEWGECDGSASPATGIHIGQQKRKTFGICYRTMVGSDADTDASTNYKIHVIYNCTASPSERTYETVNDSPNAMTFSWEITSTPVNVTGYKPTSEIVIDVWKLTDGQKLALENKLYGTDGSGNAAGTQPTLPEPNALLSLIANAGAVTTE